MMNFIKSLKGRLAIFFSASIIISLLISGLLSVGLVQRFLRHQTIEDLKSQAVSIAEQTEEEGLPLERFTQDLEKVHGVRVFIVPYGEQDLSGLPGMGIHGDLAQPSNRPTAMIDWDLLGRGETQITEDAAIPGVDREAVFAAHSITIDGELLGAVIVAKSMNLLQPWEPIAGQLVIAALIALAVSLIFAFLLARHLSRPLHEITEAATAVAEGDFSREVRVRSEDEIGRLADAFRYMTSEVQKSQQQQREFVINVSHELKTPLTAITGHAQALRDGVAADPETAATSLEVINKETDRLRRLIEDLLSLARFDARQFELTSMPVSLNELAASVCDGFSQQAKERDITLTTDIEEDIEIVTDPDRLRQILANLVQNGMTHTPQKGTVDISVKKSGEEVIITVSDTGRGISKEDLPHVFDRFYRSGEGAMEAGLGLGLSISRELARAMGGDITVDSGRKKGTIFMVNLPRQISA